MWFTFYDYSSQTDDFEALFHTLNLLGKQQGELFTDNKEGPAIKPWEKNVSQS